MENDLKLYEKPKVFEYFDKIVCSNTEDELQNTK